MTSTPCHSAALERVIVPWAAKIAEFFAAIVETILAMAKNVRTTLHEPCTVSAMSLFRTASRRLMAIRVPPERNDAARCVLLADIGAVSARFVDTRRIDLDVSLWAPRCRERLIDFDEPEAHERGSEQLACPHVK